MISGAGPVAQEIITSSANGFPWQASLGARADKMVFIAEGRSARANGREFTGPLYIARKATLGEISFVALGADEDTSARVAAGANNPTLEDSDLEDSEMETETDLEFQQWAESNNLVLDGLDEKNLAALKALYQKELKAAAVDPERGDPPEGGEGESEPVSPAVQMRAEAAQEAKRIAAVRKVCAGEHPEIEARAIEEGWDETKTELAVLRASRAKGPAIHDSGPSLSARTLEAAACLSAGISQDEVVRDYGEPVAEAAYSMRHIGLKELVAECARLEGLHIPRVFGNGKETIKPGFSTMSLAGILENVMNKTMLAAYQTAPVAAFDLASVSSVSDFKEVSRYRLLGTGGFEQVAPDGELKHGKLDEQKYTNKAETYGQILILTRRDIINDDLNAFLDIPRQMGRSGAEVIDDLFFTLLLSNPGNFFSASNGNYLTGAETAFGSDALTKAKTQGLRCTTIDYVLSCVHMKGPPRGFLRIRWLPPTGLPWPTARTRNRGRNDDGEGLDADFYISGFSRNENNEDFIIYSVTAEPSDEAAHPSPRSAASSERTAALNTELRQPRSEAPGPHALTSRGRRVGVRRARS